MTEVDFKTRIEQLSAELNRHLHAYHVLDAPTIPTPNTTSCSSNCSSWKSSTPSWRCPIRRPSAWRGAAAAVRTGHPHGADAVAE
jgi:NAD-dependent DNA ligase